MVHYLIIVTIKYRFNILNFVIIIFFIMWKIEFFWNTLFSKKKIFNYLFSENVDRKEHILRKSKETLYSISDSGKIVTSKI
jgi:hypothetical protein